MVGVIFGLFALSVILFFGMLNYILAAGKPGVYPPKQILKKRAITLGGGGVLFCILALLILWLSK